MSDKKVIAVMGATGAQGGGLARAILEDKTAAFAVRALTRNPKSDKARALADRGADVVAVDVDQPQSVEEAFAGAHGAFCVTFFWEHFSPQKELAHAQAMADAAKSNKLKHVIWSTLEDTRKWIPLDDDRMPTLMDHYKVPHFDAKGEANMLFTDAGVPTTFLLTAFYWDNFIYFGMGPKPGPDGVLSITLPMGDKELSGIAAQDIGRCAFGIFKAGDEYIGKTVGIAGGHLTGQDMADALTRALGRDVRYNAVTPAEYRAFGFDGAEDLGNMFQFKQEFNEDYCGARDLALSKSLNPTLQTFDEWLIANKSNIPIE